MRHAGLKTTAVSLLLLLALLLPACGGSPPKFQGTVIEPPIQATPFRLQDQTGETVSLSDFSGKILALTFLYTNCPDVCPLTTESLRKVYASLGAKAARVAFVAITVDPTRDTVQQIYNYSKQKDMLDKWHFLTGSYDELSPVWQGYFVAADPYVETQGGATDMLSQEVLAAQAQQSNLQSYLVAHQSPVYLIDSKGQIRVLHSDVTLDAQPLIADIRTMLR